MSVNAEPPKRDARHIPVLDGVRGVAVLMVMVCHYPIADAAEWLRPALQRLSQIGELGVDLFFVLSGFLITGILLDARNGSAHALRNFYIRRALRIFPLYYGVLACAFVLLPALGLVEATPAPEQAWFWLYMQNVGFTFFHVGGPNHFWSLAVEEHFYLAWPFIALRFGMRAVVRALLGAVGLSLLARAALIGLGFGTYYFTLCRLDGLALGGLVAVAARSRTGLDGLKPWAVGTMALTTPALVVLSIAYTGDGNVGVQIVKSTLIAAWFSALIVVAQAGGDRSLPARALSIAALRSMGTYSYAMYVFHPFLFNFLVPHLRGNLILIQYAAAFGVTYLCAAASWYAWERHFLALKDRFSYASSPRLPVEAGRPCAVHTTA